MKKITLLLTVLLSCLFTSCEEVIDLDLDTAAPKLVIEAGIYWQKGTPGNEQFVQLTTTTDYYSQTIPVVSGATVFITNSTQTRFNFTEIPNTGKYVCTNFQPVLNETYQLTIMHDGETYTATEKLQPVAPITRIEQNNEGGFTGDDIEIKAFFNDPATEDNFYLIHYVYSNKITSNYYTLEDTFFQGNEFNSTSDNDDLKAGDNIEVTHFGISKQYYEYMSILIDVAGGNNGPFQAPPATVRGNIINQTQFDNYPLGYFSLCETDNKTFTIQ
ncbi:DUF4249 domain-containing protein [Flavobacterium agrisoli]|uniref:DUF4249 domain-containing protein n=1 Tax=Flavobacterium agrisoli TaxID=2793066 RepID=A0A934UIY9_9FLAO|nr:DUF4249 domain-containing protein [Flavobacterium agrisoli]MBK0369059.1 DUF4249 domain-containing protein [Flavobacterium agrisoli]